VQIHNRYGEPTGPRTARPDDRLREAIRTLAASAVPAFVDDAVGEADVIEGPVAEERDDRLAPVLMEVWP
jgi:hypothetical protein